MRGSVEWHGDGVVPTIQSFILIIMSDAAFTRSAEVAAGGWILQWRAVREGGVSGVGGVDGVGTIPY